MFHGKGASENVVKFMSEQDAWARQQAAANTKDPFWQHVAAVLAQFDGLVKGYARESSRGNVPTLTIFAFQLLNGIGDLFQIKPVSLHMFGFQAAYKQHTIRMVALVDLGMTFF
jgi:hypothetical protein